MYGSRLSGFCYGSAIACLVGLMTSQPARPGPPSAEIDFERHIMGLFGRMGCNSGSCHGSFQGRGGFRLSLFGYDPDKDYQALTHDALGRRINRTDPEQSLVLLKPTGQMEHGGGLRFAKGSWQYRMLRDWIAGGARRVKGRGDIQHIDITPTEVHLTLGQTEPLNVRARFTDNSEEDVTRFCEFRTNDDAVAEVDAQGHVKAVQPGDTCIVVSYRGNILPVHVLLPLPTSVGSYDPAIPENNFIDREVFAKLRSLNIVPSELSGDAEFLRRVSIDTIGCLPAPEEVRSFLADTDPAKRAKKIDALLTHPLHAALWATKLCDITGNDTNALEQPRDMQTKRSQMWHDWFRKRIADNMPYDEIVRGVLCATSRDGANPQAWIKQVKQLDEAALKGFVSSYADKPTLDLFWRRQANVPAEQWAEKTAAAFLGVRLECAQCHKHPYDRWTQGDYRTFANVFRQVAVGASPETKKFVDDENARRRKEGEGKKQGVLPAIREVFVADLPVKGKPPPAKALGGPAIKIEKERDPRAGLFDWLHAPDNPTFARSFVNRVWGHYLGVGIVDPVDGFSLANPPSNDELLAALAQDFVDHHYDIRHVERAILNSRVYQLSCVTNDTNKNDRRNYAHAYVRPLMAEVVLDVIDSALGVSEKFGPDAREGSRAVEVGASRVGNGNIAYAFRVFGRPARTSACDCERALAPALPQTLYRMSDQSVLTKLSQGRLGGLLKSKRSDREILDELFLATLTRLPTEQEVRAFEVYQATTKNRQVVFTDTLWALVNTREFILNH
jgi:hypothetical protein